MSSNKSLASSRPVRWCLIGIGAIAIITLSVYLLLRVVDYTVIDLERFDDGGELPLPAARELRGGFENRSGPRNVAIMLFLSR